MRKTIIVRGRNIRRSDLGEEGTESKKQEGTVVRGWEIRNRKGKAGRGIWEGRLERRERRTGKQKKEKKIDMVASGKRRTLIVKKGREKKGQRGES